MFPDLFLICLRCPCRSKDNKVGFGARWRVKTLRNHGIWSFGPLKEWNRDFIIPIWSGKIKLRHWKYYVNIIYKLYIQKINIKHKNKNMVHTQFRKFSKISIVIFPRIIFFQDVPIYFLIFCEVSWSLQR